MTDEDEDSDNWVTIGQAAADLCRRVEEDIDRPAAHERQRWLVVIDCGLK